LVKRRGESSGGRQLRRHIRDESPGQPYPPLGQAGIVLAAGLSVRVLYWFLYSRTPFFHSPVVDASFFNIWAQNIVAGQNFQPDVFFKPPLYPYVLAFIYRTFGETITSVYVLQSLLGLANCLLVLMLGRLVFTPRIALIGAVVAAFMPILPFFELQLLAETSTTFLSLLALLFVLQATRKTSSPSWWQLALAGLLFGVAALGRPNLLLLPPVIAIWLWSWAGSTISANRAWSRWRPAVVFLVSAVLAVSPVTLRNMRVGGVFVPVCANLGVNLWTGHHEGADGTSPIPVGIQWDDLQLQCQQSGAGSAVASSRFLTGEAVQYILAHPERSAALTFKKAMVMISAAEVRNNIGAAFLAQEMKVFLLSRWWPGFWLLGPMAGLGLWGARRWGRPGQVLWLYLATLFLSVLPFFANARFRMPLVPILALWAAAGWDSLWLAWRSQRSSGSSRPQNSQPSFWFLAGILAIAFLLVNVDWYHLNQPSQHARDHFYLGTIYAKGYADHPPNHSVALSHFHRAQELNPRDPDFPERRGQQLLTMVQPWTQRADIMAERGHWEYAVAMSDSAKPFLQEALSLHEQAVRLYPRSFRSLANQGSCHLWLGDGNASRAALYLSLADSLLSREEAMAALERYAAAGRAYQQALVIQPRYPEAQTNFLLCVARIQALPALTPTISDYQQHLLQSGLDNHQKSRK